MQKFFIRFIINEIKNFKQMKIAILTCKEMPDMLPYDIEIIQLLNKQNVITKVFIWDEMLKDNPHILKQYDLILIRTIWDYYKKFDKFLKLLDFLDDESLKVLNPIDIIRWNMDKKYLIQLEDEGYKIIPTLFNFNGENSFAEAVKKGWKKMILKPMVSAGSYHTFVLNSTDESKFHKLISDHYVNRPYMIQEFIPEISEGEISTITLTSPGEMVENGFSYSVTKVPKKGDYRVQFNYGGVYHVGSVDPEIKEISQSITSRFDNRLLYQRLDGLWRNGEFLIMEIELIEPDLYLSYSKDALDNWVKNIVVYLKNIKK